MMELPVGLPPLDAEQLRKLEAYAGELEAMNRRINLISRDDVGHIASRHIPHCLTLAVRGFPADAVVADWGTGGGLPLIPLAIVFPEVRFIGIDAVAKKIQAVKTFARRLELANVETWHGRAESFPERIDYSVSRATAPLETLWSWHVRAAGEPLAGGQGAGEWPRGLVCLKGGDLEQEIGQVTGAAAVSRCPIASMLRDDYFATKEIVSVSTISAAHGQS
jgi:16S rRNA (guanine527-N7)-methyltransferase